MPVSKVLAAQAWGPEVSHSAHLWSLMDQTQADPWGSLPSQSKQLVQLH